MRCTSGGSETQGWPTLIAGDGSTHHPRPDGHLELRDVDVEVLREQLLQDSVQEALEHLAGYGRSCVRMELGEKKTHGRRAKVA